MKKNPTWKRMRCVFFLQTSNLHPNKQKYKSEKETHKNIKLKHERNIVEITHLCIRHGAHTRWI
jgi:hypothetical protein